MYSRQETSQLRKKFWTQFGQYMRPLPGAEGQAVNWLNYKTGIKHLFFRMDANIQQASIAIELRHSDLHQQEYYFEKFVRLKTIFQQTIGEHWQWQLNTIDDDEKPVSRIGIVLKDVNVFNTSDWPAIISFLKPRILALDAFWCLVKEGFK
jgi:hypothetical protein